MSTRIDRLFPSQDVLPSGGFGNLIALPLQRAARDAGNTEFLNDRLEPHRDQWSYLASVPKITPRRLTELIATTTRTESSQYAQPWIRAIHHGARHAASESD